MEAVLPLKLAGGREGAELQRALTLITSVDHFWTGVDRFTFHIILPAPDIEIARAAIPPLARSAVRFHDENDIIPGITAFAGSGWFKQQVLKLAACSIMSGAFFMTFDADIVCVKSITARDFIRDGKCCNDWDDTRQNSDWWAVSAQMVGLTKTEPLGMSVTPQMLSVTLCRDLIAFLIQRHGAEALLNLTAQSGWTEYSLYHCYAELTHTLHDFHHSPNFIRQNQIAHRLQDARLNVWWPEQFLTWQPARALIDSTPGAFMVLQSRAEIPLELYLGRIEDEFYAPYRDKLQRSNFRDLSVVEFLFAAYKALLGRDIDLDGMNAFLAQIAETRDFAAVITALLGSDEREKMLARQRQTQEVSPPAPRLGPEAPAG